MRARRKRGEDGEEEDEDDEDKPRVTKRRKRVVEEEEDEAPEPIASQPSVIPRMVNFGVGMAGMRRSFAYTKPGHQGDKGVRLGYQFAVESYPFVTQPNGAWRTIGVSAFYEKEYGDATWDSPMSGQFVGYGFNQSRWGFDARWAIPAGEWVVIVPAVGYGRHRRRSAADDADRAFIVRLDGRWSRASRTSTRRTCRPTSTSASA